jgi:hypothetical protein
MKTTNLALGIVSIALFAIALTLLVLPAELPEKKHTWTVYTIEQTVPDSPGLLSEVERQEWLIQRKPPPRLREIPLQSFTSRIRKVPKSGGGYYEITEYKDGDTWTTQRPKWEKIDIQDYYIK